MISHSQATIFAVASGLGRTAVTVLRLSGPATPDILEALCRQRPPPREARLRHLRAGDGEILDQALVLWFPAPGSYTGEDSAELHLHGGAAVLDGVADALVARGARPAEAGEFTRRAFLNGRMDLLEAEAIADLVDAETTGQRQQALRQLEGALGRTYQGWAGRLAQLMARQEALIDFSEEGLPEAVEHQDLATLTELRREIASHLDDGRRGERLRTGIVVAVTGPPNVGKSSLVNSLAARDVAMVSPHPGTTRDAIETRLVLAGVPVVLVDTAGIRDSDDPIEAEGVRRALTRAAEADLILSVHDATGEPAPQSADSRTLQVANKVDLGRSGAGTAHQLSVATGEGLPELRLTLELEIKRLTARAGPPPLTRARHRAALTEALACLDAAAAAVLPELRAEDLRMALRSIGRITGTVGVEDLLGLIFEQFCIGK